jgi:hypothetical protein
MTPLSLTVEEAIYDLTNEKNVKFKDLLKICEYFFEGPRIAGSHHIFKMPWRGVLESIYKRTEIRPRAIK